MTDFQITIKQSDLLDHELGSTGANDIRSAAERFCQCIHNLVKGSSYHVEIRGAWVSGTFRGVPDENFQWMEEIIGQTLWDIRDIP